MYQSQTKSSFNGIVDEIPDILVDNFEETDYKAYFLSHCHTDHTSGLFSDALLNYLKEKRVFIYMSEPSAAIIRHENLQRRKKYGPCDDITDYIKPLKIGSTTITIPEDEDTDEQFINVTLIPAGHCIGSVMILFRTLYKSILYTGDFRIGVNSVSKYAQLHDNGDIVKLDALYVDTTFLNEVYDDFPKRSDSVEACIQHIRKWLNANESNEVALHTSAKYGYEFVFNKIYEKLGLKVYFDDELWDFYSQFPKLVPGVTNDINSRIHRCRKKNERESHDSCFPNKRMAGKPFLFIHFSALKWREYKNEDVMVEIKDGRIDVCFATHCSKSELDYFVNYLTPKKVVGFPNKYNLVTNKDTVFSTKCDMFTENDEKNVHLNSLGDTILDADTVRQIFAD